MKIVLPFLLDKEFELDKYSNEIILLEKPAIQCLPYPVKLNTTIAVFCLKGEMKGKSNMRHFETKSPSLVVLMTDHTVIIDSISDDFSALFIAMSRKFSDALIIEERLPIFLSLNNNPCIPLDNKEVISFENYFKMTQSVLKETHNPYVLKIIQHLTKAYFYAFSYNVLHIGKHNQEGKKPRQQTMVESFLTDVQNNFKSERSIEFYANRMFVTPKYLSKVVKENNGLSAKKWIEDYVVWEAKALLKSTPLTVQQISDKLNFPSQSFFGKFFKRSVGLSPLEYRKS